MCKAQDVVSQENEPSCSLQFKVAVAESVSQENGG